MLKLIKMGISQNKRLVMLNSTARKQIELFNNNKNIKNLEILENEKNNSKFMLE